MYNFTDIKNVHLELTSKCQARCPMCPRRINGGMQNPLFSLSEIDLETFKQWFSVDFIKQLDSLFMCGNLGDPIIAQDCVEIFHHLRETNPNIQLSMHTNGSARSRRFWEQLAELKVKVTFGIDGLEDTHKLYRIDTNFNKIVENADTFIRHGGVAEWHMLVFKHNEHQIEECRKLSETMQFNKFIVKHTSRFSSDKFHVLDDSGKTTHILEPSAQSKTMIQLVKESIEETKPIISCKAKNGKGIYIGANGAVHPCCWLDFSWILHKQDSRIDYMDRINMMPNLNDTSLEDIFTSGYFDNIASTWDTNPLQECSKQCGSFDKCGAQFNAS